MDYEGQIGGYSDGDVDTNRSNNPHLQEIIEHFAFSVAHGSHIDVAIIPCDAELLAPAEIGSDLGTVDDVFAR